MSNDFRTKIYLWIFGPIYKRLFDECDAGMKELHIKQRKFQERWGTRFSVEETTNATPAETARANRS